MLENVRFTLRIMKKRPLRSLLTILQLGLGVWIVAIILSMNFQATKTMTEVNSTVGESIARLSVSKIEESEWGGRMVSSTSNLRFSDLDRLRESEYIEDAFIYVPRWERDILVNDLAYRVSSIGEASAGFSDALGLKMVEGQFFTTTDQEQQNKVVVISEAISKQLFPNQSALGQTISLGSSGEDTWEYTIIGVYQRPSSLLEFFIPESYLIFPLGYADSWFTRIMDGSEASYTSIYIKSSPGKIYEAVEDARILLADRAVNEMEVQGEYLRDFNRFFADQIRTMTLFLGAFAFVSVLISAIGILSILLVSVVERTREIGLRKALGASKATIVRQVLNESFVFSILGAGFGLIVAYFSAESLVNLLVQEVTYPKLTGLGGLHPQAALIGAGLAVLVGLVFGLYPAMQAARMSPVEALRDS